VLALPAFYFIVDRLNLLRQARDEFRMRGLTVHVIDSREAFARDIKTNVAARNDRGAPEITVVNIQKFKDDPDVAATQDYNLNVQRVYFLDEVHRSYKPARQLPRQPGAVRPQRHQDRAHRHPAHRTAAIQGTVTPLLQKC
jgi:type I site-specific restriction-modification system R (restriction) subunit